MGGPGVPARGASASYVAHTRGCCALFRARAVRDLLE